MTPNQTMVAITTEKATDFSCFMVMVNRETRRELVLMPVADGALLFLPFQEFVVLFYGNPVGPHKVILSGLIWRHSVFFP